MLNTQPSFVTLFVPGFQFLSHRSSLHPADQLIRSAKICKRVTLIPPARLLAPGSLGRLRFFRGLPPAASRTSLYSPFSALCPPNCSSFVPRFNSVISSQQSKISLFVLLFVFKYQFPQESLGNPPCFRICSSRINPDQGYSFLIRFFSFVNE